MTPTKQLRVLVVGGGLGGLSAALAMQRGGVEVRVLEQMPELKEVGAGLCVWTNAMNALTKMGVGEKVREAGGLMDGFENRSQEGELLSTMPMGEAGRKFGSPSFGIRRPILLSILAEEIKEGTVILNSKCVGIDQDDECVTVRLADGRTERGDVLVGADGLRSVVRQHVLGPSKPHYAGYTTWRAVTRYESPAFPRDTMVQWYGSGQMIGVFPVGGGMVNWYASKRTPEGCQAGPGGHKQDALNEYRGWGAPVEEIIASTPPEAINRVDLFTRKPDRRWCEGRVTVLGDAAHPMTHALGLGACTAIEDGAVLGRCLSGGGDPLLALQAYESDRRPRSAALQILAGRLGWQNHWEGSWAVTIREEMQKHTPSNILTKQLEKIFGYQT